MINFGCSTLHSMFVKVYEYISTCNTFHERYIQAFVLLTKLRDLVKSSHDTLAGRTTLRGNATFTTAARAVLEAGGVCTVDVD